MQQKAETGEFEGMEEKHEGGLAQVLGINGVVWHP